MISLERFTEIADEVAFEIPEEYYDGLNGGINIIEESCRHPLADGNPYYVLGRYHVSRELGRCIFIYYGSFTVYMQHADENMIRAKLREVIRHEFTHHLESLAGSRELEDEDNAKINSWLNKN